MAALRQIIEAAKPSVLQLFGFAHAVEHHLDRAIRDSGQMIRSSLSDRTGSQLEALDPSVTVTLFRIVQEAINNAVHHAQASEVRVELSVVRGQFRIVIEDDGIGHARSRSQSGGSGIGNMRTRARLISARFLMTGGPGGRGTRVALSLPSPAGDNSERALPCRS
jgi:signal transduction histidine kinase